MKHRLSKLTILMAVVAISGSVQAMDSTFVLPASGAGDSLIAKPQEQMVSGFTKLYTNYADYSANPSGPNSLPSNPKACDLSDTVVNFAYGPASAIQTTCTSYTCDTSCSTFDLACWSEVAACETCVQVCTVFSCSCGVHEKCNQSSYAWNGNFTGPTVLTSITCGTTGFVAQTVQAQQASQVQAAQTAGLNVAKAQINGLLTTLNNLTQSSSGLNVGGIAGTVTADLSAATAYADQLAAQAAAAAVAAANAAAAAATEAANAAAAAATEAANAVSNAASSAASDIGGGASDAVDDVASVFGGGGGW